MAPSARDPIEAEEIAWTEGRAEARGDNATPGVVWTAAELAAQEWWEQQIQAQAARAYTAQPEPGPGELEAARGCWRQHRERVRWQFGRWRPCADCLDDLRRRLPCHA
jgi:hypothetical protein